MTLALGLLLATLLMGLFAPLYLRAAMSMRVRPGVVLTGWVGSVLLTLTCAAGAGVLLAVPFDGAADTVLGMAAVCVNTGAHLWETLLRLLGVGALLTAVARVLLVAVRMRRRGVTHRQRHLAALSVLGEVDARPGPALFWLPDASPMAYSLGGRHGTIVATSGVARLAPATRAAVLAHERAHLAGRHHGLMRLADVLARALPFVPLLRAASPAVRVLVELCADDVAAHSCGASPVRDALRATSADAKPARALAMSGEAVELRMHRLAPTRGAGAGTLRGGMGHVGAVCASLTPLAVGVAVAAGVILLLCA